MNVVNQKMTRQKIGVDLKNFLKRGSPKRFEEG
jgi:hypothetical protein